MAKGKVTEDIKPSWLNPVRAAQAACKDNRGYAVVTMRVLVKRNDAMLWIEPVVEKIHPARLSNISISPALLAGMLEISKPSVDNKD